MTIASAIHSETKKYFLPFVFSNVYRQEHWWFFKKIGILGGVILIAIKIKILREHLGILKFLSTLSKILEWKIKTNYLN